MNSSNKIRVLIADDHTLVREGIRSLLQNCPDIEVVGEAMDGHQAIEKTRSLQPDLVLMDVAMPGLGGLEATLEIRSNFPKVKILVLTQYDNKEYVYRFLKAGAAGYVLKKAASTELISAIRAVYQGGSFLYPDVARAVIDGFLHKQEDLGNDPYESLTEREKQVLKLVAESCSNKEIADLLCISVKTAMGHRAHLMEKLQIHSRTDLVKFAIRKGLIEA
jgi:two-component system, NarL family, response regulator NreC